MEPLFDLKLIPEFNGSASDLAVVEWMEKLELVCRLCGVKSLEHVIFLRLMNRTFTVYQQLDDKARCNIDQIKTALVIVFATRSFMVYRQIKRHLWYSKSVDVYLAGLKKLVFLLCGTIC